MKGAGGPAPALVKSVDAWWTVLFVDPVAVPLTRLLARSERITPNRLTIAAHVLGLVSAAGFARGYVLAPAVLFEIRFVVDCCDGKLARLRSTGSEAGAFLDATGDGLVVAVNLACLGLALAHRHAAPMVLAVAMPVGYLISVVSGDALDRELARGGAPVHQSADPSPGGYRRWMAAHRLALAPHSVEAEHLVLFLAPIVSVVAGRSTPLLACGWVMVAYCALASVRTLTGAYRLAARRDENPGERGC